MKKIHAFTELIAWQKAHLLVLEIYALTATFPDIEKFGLVTQMRRAAISITSNLAEGFGRRGLSDKIRFYDIALGSLYELQSQLFVSHDLQYIPDPQFNNDMQMMSEVQRIITALIRSIKAS